MRTVRAALATVVLVGLLTGCGIPDNTAVTPRGVGPSTGRLSAGGDSAPTRNARESTTDRATFVTNYLEASAGDPDRALDQVLKFFAPAARDDFKPAQDLQVIRLVEKPLINPSSDKVTLRAELVGTLGPTGVLEPAAVRAPSTYELTIGTIEGGTGLFVTHSTPAALLLSVEALDKFYQRRTIYFWDREHTTLIPDLRYLSRDVNPELQPTEIIKWLIGGPASALRPWVQELPQGTAQLGNVPAVSDAKLQINLNAAALPAEGAARAEAITWLRHQLMWSLRPNLGANTLELTVGPDVVGEANDSDYLASNAAYRLAYSPERFCVYDGQVRRLSQSTNPAGQVPGFTAETNRNVITAALTSSGNRVYAAFVAKEGAGQALRFGAAPTGQAVVFRRAALPAPIGRPVWAVNPDGVKAGEAIGVAPAGGQLYTFAPGSAKPVVLPWQSGPADITAVAFAPDGHRLAVVAGGRLYLSVMTAAPSGGMQAAQPVQINTQLSSLSAVDWSSEGTLAIAGVGANRRWAIADLRIDGAVQADRLSDIGTAPVTHLVAYPANPMSTGTSNAVAYVADGVAYNALSVPVRIGVGDLLGPVPSPAPVGAPSAPFFLN
jgi:hypothetical protein